MRFLVALFLIASLFLSVACRQVDLYKSAIYEEKSCVGLGDKAVQLFRLVNKHGMYVKVTNYAASLTDVFVPDRQGNFEHIVLGFDSVEHYWGKHPKFGATVGRFANRIRNAEFKLQGQVYHLEKNNRGHSIHGGTKGFYRQVFETDTLIY